MTTNTGGLIIGVLSVLAALFTGFLYLFLRTFSGCYIPFSYAIFMTGQLMLLRYFNRRKSKNRGTFFQYYLVSLSVLVTLLPAAVHVSVGGIAGGCANGVFGWTILGPLVMISVGNGTDLRRALDVMEGTSRGKRHGRWAGKAPGRGFYLGLLGRTAVFALVIYFDIEPRFNCASELPAAARITMFLFHQMACPLLILIVYLQLVSWLRDRSNILSRLEGVARNRLDRSKQLTLSLVPDFASESLNRVPPNLWYRVEPLYYEKCTLIQMDVMGFSEIVSKLKVIELVDVLNGLFSSIDFAAKCIGNVWKVETIGDCYIGVIGGPQACEDHADRAILLAASILDIVGAMSCRMPFPLKVRIAVHSGKLNAAVIGRLLPRYLVFGRDTEIVNCLEPLATDSAIRVSSSTRALATYEWKYSTDKDEIQVGGGEIVESSLLAPTSPENIDLLSFHRKLYPFLSQFHVLVAKGIGGAKVRLGGWKKVPKSLSGRWHESSGLQGAGFHDSAEGLSGVDTLASHSTASGESNLVPAAAERGGTSADMRSINDIQSDSNSVEQEESSAHMRSINHVQSGSGARANRNSKIGDWSQNADALGIALRERSSGQPRSRRSHESVTESFPSSEQNGSSHSNGDSADDSHGATATAQIGLEPNVSKRPTNLFPMLNASRENSIVLESSAVTSSQGESDVDVFHQPDARRFLQMPTFHASWLGSKARSQAPSASHTHDTGSYSISRPTTGSFSSKNSATTELVAPTLKSGWMASKAGMVKSTQTLYLISVASCATLTSVLTIYISLTQAPGTERLSYHDEHVMAALTAAYAMKNMSGETGGARVDETVPADLQASWYGEEGFYNSDFYKVCCQSQTLLGIGVASGVFALVSFGVALMPAGFDEITGLPTWTYHVQRIATAILLAIAPIFTSGGLLGEQSMGSTCWPFLAVTFLAISGTRMRVTGAAFAVFFVIALSVQFLRAYSVGFSPLRLWWTLGTMGLNAFVLIRRPCTTRSHWRAE